MPITFSQRGCTVVAYQAGGALVAGRRKNGCLVEVADGVLTLQDASGELVDHGPVVDITIATPALQRKVGGATFVEMNDRKWSIDFGFSYQAERSGSKSTLGLMLGGSLKAMKFARKRNQEFVAILTREGASST
jgi:hypothetical protein